VSVEVSARESIRVMVNVTASPVVGNLRTSTSSIRGVSLGHVKIGSKVGSSPGRSITASLSADRARPTARRSIAQENNTPTTAARTAGRTITLTDLCLHVSMVAVPILQYVAPSSATNEAGGADGRGTSGLRCTITAATPASAVAMPVANTTHLPVKRGNLTPSDPTTSDWPGQVSLVESSRRGIRPGPGPRLPTPPLHHARGRDHEDAAMVTVPGPSGCVGEPNAEDRRG
jgi:hypothetical protein